MPIALLALIALHGKAMFRRSVRSVGTVRGVMFLALSAAMIALWLISGSLGAPHGSRTDPETVRAIFPWWLLGICVLNLLTSAGERAIAFSPAEVDFLFPGPFTRRQVLGYKLLKSAVGAVVTATLFALLFQRFIQSWVAGGVGIFLSLLFLQLFSMSMVLIGETLGECADTRRRRAIAVVAVAMVAIALFPVIRAARGRSIAELATGFGSTTVGQILLAPFTAFGDVVTAKHLIPDALPSLVVAGLVLATLVTILMWLDVQHIDAAARAGQKMHERIQRMRRGGVIAFRAASGARAWLNIPPLPRVGGAGPIAWRQLTTAVRQSRAVVMLLLVMCVALGPGLYMAGAGEHGDPVALIISVVVSMNVLFANALRFDFRGDLDHLDVLKSLPVTPLAIVIAQLVAPTLVLTLCQVVLFVGVGSFLRLNAGFLVAAGLVAVPLNALVFAIENLLFLLFPVRTWAASPGDLQGVGRRMTTFLAKTMVLVVGCSLAVGTGVLAWIVAGKSPSALVLTTAAVLAIETAALVPLMVTAFRRLEPSSDTAL
jgi:Putative ABC exporter